MPLDRSLIRHFNAHLHSDLFTYYHLLYYHILLHQTLGIGRNYLIQNLLCTLCHVVRSCIQLRL